MKRRLAATGMWLWKRMLRISWMEDVNNNGCTEEMANGIYTRKLTGDYVRYIHTVSCRNHELIICN